MQSFGRKALSSLSFVSSLALSGVAAAAITFVAGEARAQKPTSQTTEYSPYEKETIRRALKGTGLEVDPSPEGKVIERIDTTRIEVLEDRDPGPELLKPIPILSPVGKYVTRGMLNALHYTSRDYVIRREMLLKEGDEYVQVLVDETARNMRTNMPLQVSVVIIVPLKGTEPDKVRLLIITKDIWSLRLSFDLSVTPGGLERLLIVPQETNLLGRHHTLQTSFTYQPESYTLGAGYKIPRFGTSWIGASAGGSIYINRRTFTPEGSGASFSIGQPLYSTRTEWAWNTGASFLNYEYRRYVNAHVGLFDSLTTQGFDAIPTEYRSRTYSASASVTRSFGWAIKNNFALAFNAGNSSYDPGDLSQYNPRAAADFVQRFVPQGETRVYPSISWATYSTSFLRTLDVNTLALQEDFRLGHDVGASFYPVFKGLGSTRNILGASAHAGYTLPIGDGLVGANVTWFSEWNEGNVTDASVGASFGAVSPRIGIGRVVMNTSFLNRYQNYLRARTLTGGDDRLRGYPSNFFYGKDSIFYNLEFRSTSISVVSCQLGGVAFYDVGDAADGFSNLHAKQSLGVGIRALFPQVNRAVFRADLAFPIERGPFPQTGVLTRVDPVGFYFSFNQAFGP
ncbi:Outer membrane protein assembly factor YaeT precursor [Labilithrix luteola]|uniref:Outer membrane protein assembly factor YaeT n=1 Tax=Labilithrix luteola TaxID=1391654 RepID=A0A0K1Q5A6_9BACT|nr:hypothetical protein [Labilithrix luteola]AKV01016.1 Outer membrane protein assembly factor YaeT precursor [Labilithrix luteola]